MKVTVPAPETVTLEAALVRTLPGVVVVHNPVLTEGSSPAAGFARASGNPMLARARSVPDSK
jgi:hypothetical protein